MPTTSGASRCHSDLCPVLTHPQSTIDLAATFPALGKPQYYDAGSNIARLHVYLAVFQDSRRVLQDDLARHELSLQQEVGTDGVSHERGMQNRGLVQ